MRLAGRVGFVTGAAADARADDGKTALAITDEKGHVHVTRRRRGEMP